ncbi:MAG TPA: hypothetical protein VF834_23495 [Streptosporangiaceae bacterium]
MSVRGAVAAMKGDRIEIVIDLGDGTRSYEVSATRAGRRVDVTTRRGLVEVSELTRTGTPVRTARFMASRIIALVEYPAGESPAGESPAGRH